ncbi:hypothetical protein CLAIMM_02039 [Cladophialophora immunda]|nr:hypothetical protein CLAIMM_02039 [Cladophialophora immunda]
MEDVPNRESGLQLPPPQGNNQVYVSIAALNGGFVTLPERLFVTDADPEKASMVPSMCFLIEHPVAGSPGKSERIVFDLGIKRDLSAYAPGMQPHISKRQPIVTSPDTKESLAKGGLDAAKDIDYVMLSHVHWDHIGTPSDYTGSNFIVGSGTFYILEHGAPHYTKAMMEVKPLPTDRTQELPPTPNSTHKDQAFVHQTSHKWQRISTLANAVDFFGDGSFYLVDSPGHLRGHMNALLRVAPDKWVYLGGDCCHDPRILTGEKQIATYDDGHGGMRSVHSDLPTARETIRSIQNFLNVNGDLVEWVVAHDLEWYNANQSRFFPNWMYGGSK